MLRLSKRVEYAILAMQFMSLKSEELISAKEISENLNISFEFLSKTLQVLMKNNLVESVQGIHGGYHLAKHPDEISVSEVINALENSTGIVECMVDGKDSCGRSDTCSIRYPMAKIQKQINEFFKRISLTEISNYNLSQIIK